MHKITKMVLKFSVSNYKSFKEKKTLSFIASSIGGLEDTNLIYQNKLNILKSVAIYGPNASGKSNLLDALFFMRWYIINSSKNTQAKESIDVEPFRLNTKTEEQPSFFEIEFIIENVRYRYGFETDKNTIKSEWLLESEKTKEYPCFLRKGQEIKVWTRFKEGKKLEQKTRTNALFISVVAQFNGIKANSIINWFTELTPVHGLNTDDSGYSSKTIELLLDKKHESVIKNLIVKADFGIDNIDFLEFDKDNIEKSLPSDKIQEFKEFLGERIIGSVNTYHKKYDEDMKHVSEEKFNLDKEESEGTKKFFNIIGLIYDAVINNKIIVIDELDARLHSLLSLNILQMFNSPKNIKGQILFSAHDTTFMRNDLFRRDQINFIEKDFYGASDIISLVEYKSRRESPIEKNYLDGKYGGIPIVANLLEQ